jgi:hypothetical protein
MRFHRVAALVMCVSGARCGGTPVSNGSDETPRGETADAVSEAPVAATIGGLPRWHVYLRGRETYVNVATGPGAYPDSPIDADRLGEIVAIREGDEPKPETWLTLSLATHWKRGDEYFRDLMKAGLVSATDPSKGNPPPRSGTRRSAPGPAGTSGRTTSL